MARSTKPRLGRGLSSLIGDQSPVQVGPSAEGASSADTKSADRPSEPRPSGLAHIPVDAIQPNRHQPRQRFDEAGLKTLADSIRTAGVMQPIVVRPGPEDTRGNPGYELIAGERRWRAAQLAGLASAPAIVREVTDQEAAEFALVENLQREDLNPMDRAWAFRRLNERFGLTSSQIAERVGLDRSSVANLMRLTELDEPIREMIATRSLSPGHGKALLSLEDPLARADYAEKARKRGWSVRALERAVAERAANLAGERTTQSGRDPRVTAREARREELERAIGEHLGTRVRIRTDARGARGQLVIEFFDLDHFDSLLGQIGFEPNTR